MRIIKVKNINIGEGKPKICVPMVGTIEEVLMEEAHHLKDLPLDLVEWRVDFFQSVEDIAAVKKVAQKIRAILIDIPLLFTFRSKKEGGEKMLAEADYFALAHEMIASGLIDLIDLELFMSEDSVKEAVQSAKTNQVKVVMCNHDFDQTPEKNEIIKRLCRMQALEADICKIAVMPHNAEDVITLLAATNEMYSNHADRPIVTMSMGKLGAVSRLSGETFGSAITFGAAQKASAPGQIPVAELADILTLLH